MAEYLKVGGKAVMHNPADYTITTTAVYNEGNYRTEVTRVERKTLGLDLFFDTTTSDGSDVTKKMDQLLPGDKPVELLWGGKTIGCGDVKSWFLNGFEKRVTLFAEDGTPIRGFLRLAFQSEERAKTQGTTSTRKTTGSGMKVQLGWNDGKSSQSLAVAYNPDSYRIYDAAMRSDAPSQEQNLGRGKHHVEFTVFFDAGIYDKPEDLKKEAAKIAQMMRPLEDGKKKSGGILPEARLDFGTAKPLKGLSTSKAKSAGKWYLVKLVERYTRFSETGEPLRAGLDLTFVEA